MREQFMQRALELAQQAEAEGEVPVGAVLVLNDEIIGEGFNQPISVSDPTAHAEIIAIRQAAEKINNYRLINSTLYVTLEPCAMCANALIHARVEKVVFGAKRLNDKLNHIVEYEGGILESECSDVLKNFFKVKR